MTYHAGYHEEEWKAALTFGMPAFVDWDIQFGLFPTTADIIHVSLTGMVDKRMVFDRDEFINMGTRSTEAGSFNCKSHLSGMNGAALKYMDNLAVFAYEHLGLERIQIRAGDKLGGYRWADAGFNLDYPSNKDGNRIADLEEFSDHLKSRFKPVAMGLPVDVADELEFRIGCFLDHAQPGCVLEGMKDAPWHIAQETAFITAFDETCATPQVSRDYNRAAVHFNYNRPAACFNEAVPVGAYLLAGSAWNGVLMLNNETQRGRLRDAVTAKFTYRS